MARSSVLAVVACVLLVLGGPGRAQEEAEEARFEVLVLGTIHAPWQFRARGIHPGYVRAALAAAEPDVVGVESNPAWFAEGIFHDVTYEAQRVAVPFAKAKGIPVHGVDWMDVPAWRTRTGEHERQRAEALRRGRLSPWMFGRIPEAVLARTKAYFEETARESDFRHVNDVGGGAYGAKWLAGAAKLDPYGGRRNQAIAARCVEVMEAHAGGRLVVVIGAGHKAVLDEIFRRRGDVRVLAWGEDVPAPTDVEAEAALTLEDRVVILGHNLDGERSYFHPELVDLDRMAEVLAAYREEGGDPSIAAYFEARLRSSRGEDASETWADLADVEISRDLLYPFPLNHWRMAYHLGQAARLEGRLALASLADEMPEPEGEFGPAWRQAFLAKAYPRFLLGPAATEGVARDPKAPAAPEPAWRAHDPAHGALALTWDAEEEAHRVRLTHPEGAGLPYLGCVWDAPARELVFTARVRGRGVATVTVAAYVWPEGSRARTVAKEVVRLPADAEWVALEIPLDVPAGLDRVGVNVYASRSRDGTLWLREGRIRPRFARGEEEGR